MTEPTDAELLEVIREAARGGAIRRDGSTSLRIARAVLAKFGTPPAVAGEPFGYFHQLLDHKGNGNGVWLGTAQREVTERAHTPGETSEEIVTLYATPQPTQAQAVNKADRPFIVRLAEDFAEECVTAGYVTTKAASYGRLMDEALSTQAQAGAVPLALYQRDSIKANAWRETPLHGYFDADEIIDAVEAAHGIKGGQHGADT